MSEDVCKNIIINCVIQAFADSNIASAIHFDVFDYPLGKLNYTVLKAYNAFVSSVGGTQSLPPLIRAFSVDDLPQIQAAIAVRKEFKSLLEDLERRDSQGLD